MGNVYVDYSTGRLGVLFPSSTDKFFAGPAFQVPVPIDIKCRLSVDPFTHQTTLHWQDKAGEQFEHKLELRREEVTFKIGDVCLSGTLVLAAGHGRHPAIVRIHGAGPQTRRNTVDDWYAYHGVAYLSFDNRDSGKSAASLMDHRIPLSPPTGFHRRLRYGAMNPFMESQAEKPPTIRAARQAALDRCDLDDFLPDKPCSPDYNHCS